ncbi:MAG: DEAD/DEAH box helicase [Stellaceae bacterium]
MTASLREFDWPRFLKAPDGQLVARLYEPSLHRAVKYERCCAYFSSSVLSAAAAGFGAFIERILAGEITEKPALHLLVNEELSEADVDALLQRGQDGPLIDTLLARFGTPQTVLQKRRLEMLAWLAREGWLEVRVGVMRLGGGILHAKFGLFTDAGSDSIVFAGSDNESAQGVRGNFEILEISKSWHDAERYDWFRAEFDGLWAGTDAAVKTVPLPQAVREKLIRFAPEKPPVREAEDDLQRRRAAMLWGYALAAPFMPDRGAATCDAMAPVTLWPHQRGVVAEVSAAWPAGRLLCDEVGMGKTIEAILVLRRLLAGRGVARALILPPANLLPQWQGELREKGGLRVPRLEGLRKLVWPDGSEETVSGLAEALDRPLLLLSRETARTEGNLPILLAAKPWDLVLLDEGHAARRSHQVEGEFNSPTLLLGLLRRLRATGQARGILILSATPMQTHVWEPWDLLQVLGEGGLWLSGFHVVRRFYDAVARVEAGVLSRDDAVELARILAATLDLPKMPDGLHLPDPHRTREFAEALRFLPGVEREAMVRWLRQCSPLMRRMHRNTRRTLQRYYEMELLDRPPPKRDVREDPFDFATDEERCTYEAVKEYIDQRFDELEEQKAGKGFVMTIYRRRAASSPVALRKSLERRETGLKAVIAQRAFDEGDVLGVEDAQELQDLLNVQLTSALPDSPAEAQAELRQVQGLLERIANLGALDTKRDRAVAWVKQLTADGRSVLVFTSYTDTMEYLREALLSAGVPVASYCGEGGAIRADGKWQAVAKEAVTAALDAGKIRALVCTDAASEGLNLQSAGALVNFDLPWNPSKVEQRIGRIDRIGQAHPVLPIVNLYLKDSIDQRVYRALARRCGLFERYVGPMQPVLSLAMRMLAGREHIDEQALADLARQIENNPAVTEAFPDEEVADPAPEPPLIGPEDTEALLAALDGTGIEVRAETNTRHVIGEGPLRIVTDPGAIPLHPGAACIDGLDLRQWTLLRQLQRPGERLPLLLVSVEHGAFKAMTCGWIGPTGMREVCSFADLKRLVAEWDGAEPTVEAWNAARVALEDRARTVIEELTMEAKRINAGEREQQCEAARLRVVEELGRLLVCSPPDTDDLNGKFHRLALEATPTAGRLRIVFNRLGAYPEWTEDHLAELRAFHSALTSAEIKSRLTGRELDAGLADPRWEFGAPQQVMS